MELLKRCKRPVVPRYENFSDEAPEFPFRDRLNFQEFVRWTMADTVPDVNPLGPLGIVYPLSRTDP